MVRELGNLIDNSSKPRVIINSLTPGACHSDFMRESAGNGAFVQRIAAFLLFRSTEVGSRTLVAAAGAGEDTHGKFMADCHVSRFVVSNWCLDTAADRSQ